MVRLKKDRFAARRDRLTSVCKRHGVDAMLINSPVNVSYLAGFSGEDSCLFVCAMHCLLVSDSRFSEQIQEECPGLDMVIRRPGQLMPAAIANVIRKSRLLCVGFESTAMTVAGLESLDAETKHVEWVGLEGTVEALRSIKDGDEVRQIREAVRFAERAFDVVRATVRPDDTEKGLVDALDGYVRRCGATESAFRPIVATGPRAALPHAVPTSRRLAEDDFALFDWGAKGKFYNSDLTRILVTRKISAKLAKVYDIVHQAQQQAIRSIRPGVRGQEVDAAARSYIEQAGYGRFFGHGLGHGLGLEVHEAPSLRQQSDVILKAGMVVTVEPGIYLSGWGGVRLEDDVLVTKDGYEVLTGLPKRLEEMVVAQ